MDGPPPGDPDHLISVRMGVRKLLVRGGRRGVVATVVAAVFAVSGATIIGANLVSPSPPSPSVAGAVAVAKPASPHPILGAGVALPSSKPVAIDIPAIGVHSVVQQLGLQANGALEVPAPGPHYDETAWYEHSPTPGSLGPSIITGHVDSVTSGPSVFFELGDLEPGDRVMVTRADGMIAEFEVEAVRRYPKDEFPTQLVYGDIDHAGLRLITCGGPFDRELRHYLDNVIVFGSLVDAYAVNGEADQTPPAAARRSSPPSII